MKTFEGSFTIKWSKNDSGDRRPLTIDTESEDTLKKELYKFNKDVMTIGENNKLPYSIKFNMNERK